MPVTKQEYDKMNKKASPPSKSYKTIPCAFLTGGLICALGEGFAHTLITYGTGQKLAFALTSVTLIFISALLTGLGCYDKIAKHAGAGTLVPITGFANSVVAPALEFKAEGFVLGLGAKMFIIAGPVIVYGTVASAVYGVIYYIVSFFT